MERSCMCCQESGEREASVSLFCPKAKPGERKFRKVPYVTILQAQHQDTHNFNTSKALLITLKCNLQFTKFKTADIE